MANPDMLVVVFLRGGCDGLNMLAPSGDSIYVTERKPESRVERTGDNPGLQLTNNFSDADFRFHFKAKDLKDLYDQKHLALVHACGLTNGTRSHFEAIDYMERGTPENKNTPTGWLTRLAQNTNISGLKVPVVSTANTIPVSLLSCSKAIAIPNVKRIQLHADNKFKQAHESILKQYYRGNDEMSQNGWNTLELVDTVSSKIPKDAAGHLQDYTPSPGINYPKDGYAKELSDSLASLAQLIKMDLGVQFATADYGGWDTHVGQGYRFPQLVDGLSRSLSAFWNDLSKYHDKLTVVVMSEFGRRLRSNESGGTDHGHGNVMMVLGGKVNGGNIYGKWPGLQNDHLDNQVDLAITTDYRDVLAEIITKSYHPTNITSIFPGLAGFKPLGIINA